MPHSEYALSTYPYALQVRGRTYECTECDHDSLAEYLWIHPSGDVRALCAKDLNDAIAADLETHDTMASFWKMDIEDLEGENA